MATGNPSPSSNLIAQCHCKAVTIHLPQVPKEINECRCTVCYKLGALWTYYPRKDVRVLVKLPPGTDLTGEIGAVPPGGGPPLDAPSEGISNAGPVDEAGGSTTASADKDKDNDLQRAQYVYYDPITSAALGTYVRSDVENLRRGVAGNAFMRCKQCGSLTHWWRMDDDEGEKAKMGVNTRLMDEEFVWGDLVEREISRFD